MFILFGTRRSPTTLGQAMHDCMHCRQPTWFTYVRVKSWFTLFFLPIIPLSSTTTAVCNRCGWRQNVPEIAAHQALAAARVRQRGY